MSSPVARSFFAVLLFAVVSSAASAQRVASAGPSAWRQYVDVRQAGFDEQALRAVCARADSLKSGALMVVFRGHVILACGDVTRKFEAFSVRKSLVSGLYGTAVARGEIDLDASLASMKVDDLTPLTASEQSATLRQVISARSGVYLPSAYGAGQERGRPARGSHPPGTHWYYNNWDFNIAGVIFERAAREDLYDAFTRRFAAPLGMEDWTPADGYRVYEPTKSRHPAHTFRISTRDLARFGQLYLQEGQWAGRQILASDWVKESTRPHTDDGDGTGYGYMWWTYQAGSAFTATYPALHRYTFYRGLGTGEQGLWVIREAGLVVVHRADMDHARVVESVDHWKLVESILAARRTEPASTSAATAPDVRLEPLKASALASQLPPAAVPEDRAVAESEVKDYLGDYATRPDAAARLGSYRVTPGVPLRVFLHDAKPYVHLPGIGDVRIFPTAPRDTFTARVSGGLRVVFARGANSAASAGANSGVAGGVTGVTLTQGDHAIEAFRAAPPP